jgi:aspartyl-tRNA(Asn)/glutamyl-tRNA(Gln) amidotransferase subunit A
MKLGRMLREKKISCMELTLLHLDAAKRLNPELRAYISLTEETALSTAAKIDGRISKGEDLPPLSGIPFVLKDNIVTSGIKTTCGSKMLENYTPIFDASVWEYLDSEGAVLIGKGNLDEFAMGSTGETSWFGGALNPHNTNYVAGGSSGGVAAAVAAGTAVFGIGSDTGGSIRQPASFCGLVGLKPTYGAVSRNGLVAFASSLDQIGSIATTTRDAALVYDAICRRDERDMTSVGGKPVSVSLSENACGMKIGVAREFYEDLMPDVARAMDETLKTLEKAGANLVTVDFPLLRHSLSAYYVLVCAEASSNLGRYDGLRYGYSADSFENIDDMICRTRSEGFGAEVRRRLLLGTCVLSTGYYDAYYSKALQLKNAISDEYDRILGECDCLVTPTVPTTAIKRGVGQTLKTYQTDICTVTVNIAGLPAVSVPCGFDSAGLPVGLQIIGKKFREDVILGAALAFETETDGKFIRSPGLGVVL